MDSNTGKFFAFIDRLSEISGKTAAWLLIIVIVVMIYETIARYFFNSPTIWAYDLTCMLFGTYFMVGAASVSKEKQHVKVDIFYGMMSPKGKAILDIFFDVIIFFPFIIILFIYSAKYAALSWAINEKSWQSVWYPPLYPFKTMMPLAFLLLGLQGLADFARNILFISKGKEL